MTEAPAAGGGNDIGAALKKEIGPLPVGAWIVVLGGALAVVVYTRRRAALSVDEPADDGTENGLFGSGTRDGVDSTWPGVGAAASNPTSGAVDPSQPSVPAPTTNEEWHSLAIRRLLAKGYSPLLVDAALRNYLAGEILDRSQQAVIAEALVIVGAPPIAPPPPLPGGAVIPTIPVTPKPRDQTPVVVKIPTPVKPPVIIKLPAKPAKPTAKTYTVKNGDTLGKIASAYKVRTATIYAKNKAVIEAAAKQHGRKSSSSGTYIYPGTRLVIS